MVFENIKKHFEEKRKKKQIDFVFECEEKSGVCYIVEQKIAELMLANGWSLTDLLHCDYVNRLGFHFGEDKKVYERYELNEKGKWLYDFSETKAYGINYLQALHEMNGQTSLRHLKAEKRVICENFKKNKISKMKEYHGEELKPAMKEAEAQAPIK